MRPPRPDARQGERWRGRPDRPNRVTVSVFRSLVEVLFECKQPGAQPGILLISIHLLRAEAGDAGYRPLATNGRSDLPPWQVTAGGSGV